MKNVFLKSTVVFLALAFMASCTSSKNSAPKPKQAAEQVDNGSEMASAEDVNESEEFADNTDTDEVEMASADDTESDKSSDWNAEYE